jgi:hypothetical protein
LPFEIQVGKKPLTVIPPPSVTVGVERVNRRLIGEPNASGPVLKVYGTEGRVTLAGGSVDETIEGPTTITFDPDGDGSFTDRSSKPAPSWVTESSLPPFEQDVADQFLKFFSSDRGVLASLVDAYEDPQKDVCRKAISALRAVGDISLVVPLLNKRASTTAPSARREALRVLRAYLAQGGDAVKNLREQLQREFGDDLARTTEKLLLGYTDKEAGDEATYSKLVQLLSTTDETEVGVRSLALENLQQLTGRDDLEYDPEKPEGKGLKAWKDLLREHSLPPPQLSKPDK